MARHSLRQHLVFMTDAIVVEAGTCTDAVFEGDVAKDTHPDARRRGVANAHFADAENATAFSYTIVNKVRTNLNSTIKLLFAHGWPIEEVLGAASNLAVNDAYRREESKIAKIGFHVFDRFILPIVRNVADLIGVQCLYIYALPKERLIQYYASLGFMRLPSEAEAFVHSHVKPAYDRGCIFMYQGI